jgi:hypothetical protein
MLVGKKKRSKELGDFNMRFLRWAALIAAIAPSGLFATDVTLDFVSPGNNIAGYYYISPYTAQIAGTGQLLTLYCIDFNHEVDPPAQWNATIQAFDYANVPNMQYGGGGQNQQDTWFKYETAAYLIGELMNSPDDPQGLHQQAIYQYAAWKIFLDPAHTGAFNASEAAAGGPTFAAAVDAALNGAVTAALQGTSTGQWEIVTPDAKGLSTSTQEFLIFNPNPTPEPSALILLVTVLGGVAFFVRRVARRQADSSTTGGT